MKHKCTNCGHVDEIKATNQAKGGKARWKGTTKKQRSLAAKKAVAARWAKSEKINLTHAMTEINSASPKANASHGVEVQRRVRPCLLSSRHPCRDYDHECDDMTMAQMCACHASTHPLDDHIGYCVIQQRWS